MLRRVRSIALGLMLGLVLSGLSTAVAPAGASTRQAKAPVTLRLGYFPNVTHATAIVGVEGRIFEDKVGKGVKLELSTFSAGPAAIEALFSDALDATYVGPNPTINAYAQSHGDAVRIISGATSGGAFLVVKKSIRTAKDLKGKVLASPQLGNTQDVALRSWLKSKGLSTDTSGGGDVSIRPQDNALTLQAFEQGDIDGAWVPEPWATRLVTEGGGKVLVDERTLWPHGRYVTTQLIVRTDFLKAHRDVVKRLLAGQVAANDFLAMNRKAAEKLVAKGIENITGTAIAPELVTASFDHLTFTDDPIASSLRASAKAAVKVGLLDPVDLSGLYDLRLLNAVLKKTGEPTVSAK